MEGEKSVAELLTSRFRVTTVYALSSWMDVNAGKLPAGVEAIVIDKEELVKISNHQSPQGVLAVAEIPAGQQAPVPVPGLAIALDTIQDPGNLGTIIRIADWYGIPHVVCSEGCADVYNPKTLSASMGSFTRVQVSYTRLEDWLPAAGVPVFATMLNGTDVHKTGGIKQGVILTGNEGRGLRPELVKLASHHITIPSFGGAESLNAAVATAIVCDNFRRA